MTSDLLGMMRAVEGTPKDDGTKLVAADAAAEAGDFELEAALRWCVREGKWPQRYSKGSQLSEWGLSWHWSRQPSEPLSYLPEEIERRIGPDGWYDPDLWTLLRRTGEGIIALEL